MKEWSDLYQAHGGMRSATKDLEPSLRRRLVALAERGHCARTIQGRFTKRDRNGLRELYIHPTPDRADPCEPLLDLPELDHARLTLLALISRKAERVHQFTAMIEGTARDDRTRKWAVAIHLEDDRTAGEQDRKGGGACSHAVFHCHVGPTLDDKPKVRVPLPAVGPVGAFDWLLSTVIPGWEPAPWPAIVAMLSKA